MKRESGERGENRKERDVTPVYANVSPLYIKHGLGVTLSEPLEVYIFYVTC